MRDRLVPTVWPLALLALLACACGDANGRLLGGQLPGRDIPSWEPEIDEKTAIELRVGRCGDGVAQVELIDDMEDGDAALLPVAGRSNSWFAFNDASGGTQLPFPTGVFRVGQLTPPRGSSRRAVHTSGTAFGTWGAGVGFKFLLDLPYDAARYAGLGFWARVTSDHPPQAMRMNVSDRNTSPYGDVCDVDCQNDPRVPKTDAEDYVCDPSRGDCFDDFGADFSENLSTEWSFFKFPWPTLKTANWSEKNLTSLATHELYKVQFQTSITEGFDFWIDDVYFLCPAGR